jgi:5-methylcytosine-specific restriction protein A
VFDPGRVYRRQSLHDEYGGQRYGGISTPARHPIILLISGEAGAEFGYDDEFLDDGTLLYFGEGRKGDMTFTAGNLAIREHGEQGEELHLFEKVRSRYVRYVGQYDYAGHEIRPNVRDQLGELRTAIVFRLVPHEQLEEDEREGDDEVVGVPDDLAALRAAALEPPPENLSPGEGRRQVWRRSRAVCRYVLLRASGVCEGCSQPAPFTRPNGQPYLEPHHTRRISDGGPDHPAWVIALCPTCHRRVHYGDDGDAYNQELMGKLGELEAAVAADTA